MAAILAIHELRPYIEMVNNLKRLVWKISATVFGTSAYDFEIEHWKDAENVLVNI